MKRVQKFLVAGMFMLTLTAMASDGKVISEKGKEVTITEEKEMVDVSILNTANDNYTLYIINPNGEVVFNGTLGNDASLGKRFDFKGAIEGKYTFRFTTSAGERFTYSVRTGSIR